MAEVRFLTNEAGKIEGLSYAGFETFRGSPYTSCARETGQNSRDAASGNLPVSVHFNLHELPRADIPFADELQHSIECCLLAPQDEKTRQHLLRAHEAIGAPRIKVLEISDYHTTGLKGPTTDPGSVFAALVKGDGVTNKAEMTSAGSFGIGKNAAFAVSDLQTVIYSTCYLEEGTGETRFAAQGRLRLISHINGEKNLGAEGYWGSPGFAAIEDDKAVPDWLARTTVGTSIFSIGFREEEQWADRMALSLVTNFFLAIERQEIEFVVNGLHINRVSLDGILASPELKKVAADADQSEELDRALRLVECMRSEAAIRETIHVADLGDFDFHLLVQEGMPRETHVLRNGIYITDNFAKFSEPLRRFPGTREFTSVLEPARKPAGRKPSSLLKQLENPAHDALEPERIVNSTDRDAAKRQIKALIRKMRDIIRSAAKMDDVSRSHLDELSHLFADPGNGSKVDDEKDPEHFKYGSASIGKRARLPGTSGKGDGKGKGTQRATRAASKSPRTGASPSIPLLELRSVLGDVQDQRKRTIFFTPGDDGNVELRVAASGLTSDTDLQVVKSSAGATAGGAIEVAISKGKRVQLDVVFSEPFAGPIELVAVSLQPQAGAE
ncbi:hypothetical protein SAMN05518669_11015 [Variovorax sp. YR634]|uniref:hypothetical protein n=1 Tax=Variovorax sp. YR634 TaxID=1884385 RepID=UPI00089C086A|nr:hypothetical protein [Variovorax sp. YR634]SDY18912.1 hypothetical protein SAMN05518669_11015 [Variovorax sp. YR634]